MTINQKTFFLSNDYFTVHFNIAGGKAKDIIKAWNEVKGEVQDCMVFIGGSEAILENLREKAKEK